MQQNELQHHGVKGMKWGVRRYQNPDGTLTEAGKKRYGTAGPNTKIKGKEFFEERRTLKEKYITEDPEYAKTKGYRKQIHELLDKYDFDPDDGGGGSTTADRKAGEKYMKLWEEYSDLSDRIMERATNKAANELIEKYGEKRVKDIERANNVKAAAIVTAVFATPVVALVTIASKGK